MNNQPSSSTPPHEEKSTLAALAVQLFVIPLAVVVFCIALGAMFMWLTTERKDLDDYIHALKSSRDENRAQQAQFLFNYIQESKRWQGIFDVTAQMAANRDDFLSRHPKAGAELTMLFDQLKGKDPRARRYLALVLGLLNQPESLPALRMALDDADPETVKNAVWSLGRMADRESLSAIIQLTGHADYGVRLMSVYALGLLHDPRSREVLLATLQSPDVLMQWNAAFGLATHRDTAPAPVLERLLDADHVAQAIQSLPAERRPTPQNLQRYRVAAVMLYGQTMRESGRTKLEEVSRSDPDLRVRGAALQQLENLDKNRRQANR